MIKRRDFYHQNLKYSFNWNLKNHKETLSKLKTNQEDFKKLGAYFKKIYKGSFVPDNIFNTKNIPRVSQFKIKGLKIALLRSISKKLIRSGKIMNLDFNSRLPNYARKVYESYIKNNINRKPGHEPILKNILIKDNNSIAIEVPIWNKTEDNYITGHIDLIQFEKNYVKVIDYKPEGDFLRSLPQVATYGLLMKKNLKLNDLLCISFNKNGAWVYNPKILLTDLKKFLKFHKIFRPWEEYL